MTHSLDSARRSRLAGTLRHARCPLQLVCLLGLAAVVASAVVVPTVWAQEDAPSLRKAEEQAIKTAVDQVAPSVVRIETLGGLERVNGVLVGAGPTTGVVVDEAGYVLSSAFNFVQMPSSVLVTLPSGKRAAAEIVARDQSKMLVLLKLNTDETLVVPPVVPRDELTVGQWTIAVGRTFSPELPNVSVGVLSAKNRIWGKAVQTDAKISPSNYGGPLIDIHGRVIGVLVPLSPQQQGEMAGAEWYDSGIGFAIPLDEILPKLETLKKGEDLKPGIIGIGLDGKDLYAKEVKVAAVRPNSPAAEAGLKVDDVIVEANGQPIRRQAQLKHVLGPLYAGDRVELKVRRGDQQLPLELTLIDELVPYEHAFLGILPDRQAVADAVAVRYVYPESPADQAGIQTGDRITQVGTEAVANTEAFRQALANLQPQEKVQVSWKRGDETMNKEVTLASLPTAIPGQLPPAFPDSPEPPEERPPVGSIEIQLPEEANKCFAYVPTQYHPDVPHALAVVLHPPGGFQKDTLEADWKEIADKHHLIVLAPQAQDPERWSPTEDDFIRKTMTEVTTKYNVDPSRVAAVGEQAGGAMAYLLGFRHRDTIRGIVTADAGIPRLAGIPDNEPLEPLGFVIVYGKESRAAEAIETATQKLRDAKFPVTSVELEGKDVSLSAELRKQIGRWIDTLDRL